MKRRHFLAASGSAALLGTTAASRVVTDLPGTAQELTIQSASYDLGQGTTNGLISLSPDAPPPVLRGTQGQPMAFDVINTTQDYTAMHWHGLRIPNGMDGVPYLTQFPIAPDERFPYRYTTPDAGTYWYHPHCMTMVQMTRGLTGPLIIEEAEPVPFDAEHIVNLKDFRLDGEGAFLPAFTARGAARSGTFGNVITANWQHSPTYEAPTGGIVRLRVINTDTTRVHRMFFKEATGRILAWDGHPVRVPIPMPTEAEPLHIGPGQRFDVALVMPEGEGQTVELWSRLPGTPRVMTTLRSVGANLGRVQEDIVDLPPNPIAVPDLDAAQTHEFVFGWSPEGDAPNNGFCGDSEYIFWSINRTPWAGDAEPGVGPLATLEQGKSYICRLMNESPNAHPIHLHGLVFAPILSNQGPVRANWTDTYLLRKGETVDIAFVADNPGDWAFHCHVIEHQKTGLAGYVRVV